MSSHIHIYPVKRVTGLKGFKNNNISILSSDQETKPVQDDSDDMLLSRFDFNMILGFQFDLYCDPTSTVI